MVLGVFVFGDGRIRGWENGRIFLDTDIDRGYYARSWQPAGQCGVG
jgi:hypothetical protein